MTPRIVIDTAEIPGESKKLNLYRRGSEFSISVGTRELMNSRVNGSEKELAERACRKLSNRSRANILIGGLGMGFTLATALNAIGPASKVVVAELVPGVIEWNRGILAELAGAPLKDRRVTVRAINVGDILPEKPEAYDAIILDVDNGPSALTHKENDRLYSMAGLFIAYSALRPRGVLAVWSAGPDPAFSKRLRKAGFEVDELRVRANGRRGARQIIWLASKGLNAPGVGKPSFPGNIVPKFNLGTRNKNQRPPKAAELLPKRVRKATPQASREKRRS